MWAIMIIINYDNVLRSEAVESCEVWAESTTQQVDLVFNIFFAVYFFIRVSRRVAFIAGRYGVGHGWREAVQFGSLGALPP